MLFIEWKAPLMPRFNFANGKAETEEEKKRKEMCAVVWICIKNPLLILMSVTKHILRVKVKELQSMFLCTRIHKDM